MLLRLLARCMPPKDKGPTYHRMAPASGITWLDYKSKIIFGTCSRPDVGDTIISKLQNGKAKLYRVVLVDNYQVDGKDKPSWIGTLEPLHIDKDEEGYPVLKTKVPNKV